MSFRSSLALLKVPAFAPTLLAMLLAVLAEAVAGSYTALLAVQKVGMTPLELSLFMTLASLSGIVIATYFGHRHDKRPVRWPLLLSLAAKIVGFGLAAVVREAWMLIVIGFTLSWVCSRSQGQPPGARSRAISSTKRAKSAPASVAAGDGVSSATR